jgi:hypothetical protein
MSKKGQTRDNRQDRRAKVPPCQHTAVWPPFCAAADWLVAAVLATEIVAGAGIHH